jgi:hypothetical protein
LSELLLSWDGPILIADYQMKSADRDMGESVVNQRLTFTKGARDFFSSEVGTQGIMAAAIITDTLYKQSLTNFFLSVTRPSIPTRMLKDGQKAKEWLLTFQI